MDIDFQQSNTQNIQTKFNDIFFCKETFQL